MADIPFPLLVALGVVVIVILAVIGNFVANNFHAIIDFFADAFYGLTVVAVVTLILFVLWQIRQNPAEIHTAEETLPKNDDSIKPAEEGLPRNEDAKQAGVAAYHAGKYEEAYRLLKPLVVQGDAGAEAYVKFISEKDSVGDK